MLKGKTAVVTGGSRGIGAAVAKKLASLGADIAVVYAGNTQLAQDVCDECINSYNVAAKAYCCNVADFEAVKALAASVKSDFSNIGILVNNAGITRDGLILTMKESDYDAVLNTNLKGAFNMIRHFSPLFVRGKYGRIVNISSVAGIMGNPGQANYSASKAGLIGLTKTVARELASKNITCNAIAPGLINTDMTSDLDGSLIESIPLRHPGTPQDIADAAAYLVCADYVTGEVLRVDGGIAM